MLVGSRSGHATRLALCAPSLLGGKLFSFSLTYIFTHKLLLYILLVVVNYYFLELREREREENAPLAKGSEERHQIVATYCDGH